MGDSDDFEIGDDCVDEDEVLPIPSRPWMWKGVAGLTLNAIGNVIDTIGDYFVALATETFASANHDIDLRHAHEEMTRELEQILGGDAE